MSRLRWEGVTVTSNVTPTTELAAAFGIGTKVAASAEDLSPDQWQTTCREIRKVVPTITNLGSSRLTDETRSEDRP